MDIYIKVVIISVIISSAGLLVLFRKRGIGRDIRSVLTISATSLAICLLVPLIFRFVGNLEGVFNDDAMKVLIAIAITFFSYLILLVAGVFIFSSISSNVFSKAFSNNILSKIKTYRENKENKKNEDTVKEIEMDKEIEVDGSFIGDENESNVSEFNTDDETPDLIYEYEEPTSDLSVEYSTDEEPTNDLSVQYSTDEEPANDFSIEYSTNTEAEVDSLTVDQCLELAFEMKERECLEDAIQYYMYALDKRPEKDIVFWVIVDICTIYKSLGKIELAKYILESYTEMYRDVMEDNVRYQIEKNLLMI